MRFYPITVILLISMVCLGGCSIYSDGQGGSYPSEAYDRSAETIAEIDAAADLNFDDAKTKALLNIASRPHLSARSQVYLVKKTTNAVKFDANKRNVLVALINNPYFVAEGKKAILDNISAFTFHSNKEKIADAINARGHIPSELELKKIQKQQMEAEKQKPMTTEINGVQVQTSTTVMFNMQTTID